MLIQLKVTGVYIKQICIVVFKPVKIFKRIIMVGMLILWIIECIYYLIFIKTI
jgi:hypothetical protein